MTADYKDIRLLVLDVDGVMTDGRIVLTPDGQEIKSFHARDGAGMKYWKRCGGMIGIITGRSSPAVTIRAKELDADACRLGARDKLPAYLEMLSELSVEPGQAAVVADDLPDLPLLLRCALPIAAGDAVDEVKSRCAYVTRAHGGCGCVREAIELILKGAGRWDGVLERYLQR